MAEAGGPLDAAPSLFRIAEGEGDLRAGRPGQGVDLEDVAVRGRGERRESPVAPQPARQGGDRDRHRRHLAADRLDQDGVVVQAGLGAVVVELELGERQTGVPGLGHHLGGKAGDQSYRLRRVGEPAREGVDPEGHPHGAFYFSQGWIERNAGDANRLTP